MGSQSQTHSPLPALRVTLDSRPGGLLTGTNDPRRELSGVTGEPIRVIGYRPVSLIGTCLSAKANPTTQTSRPRHRISESSGKPACPAGRPASLSWAWTAPAATPLGSNTCMVARMLNAVTPSGSNAHRPGEVVPDPGGVAAFRKRIPPYRNDPGGVAAGIPRERSQRHPAAPTRSGRGVQRRARPRGFARGHAQKRQPSNRRLESRSALTTQNPPQDAPLQKP
jgi:hypothetical protein